MPFWRRPKLDNLEKEYWLVHCPNCGGTLRIDDIEGFWKQDHVDCSKCGGSIIVNKNLDIDHVEILPQDPTKAKPKEIQTTFQCTECSYTTMVYTFKDKTLIPENEANIPCSHCGSRNTVKLHDYLVFDNKDLLRASKENKKAEKLKSRRNQ